MKNFGCKSFYCNTESAKPCGYFRCLPSDYRNPLVFLSLETGSSPTLIIYGCIECASHRDSFVRSSTSSSPASSRAKCPIPEPSAFPFPAATVTNSWAIQSATEFPSIPISSTSESAIWSPGLPGVSTLWLSHALWISSTWMVSPARARLSTSTPRTVLPSSRAVWTSRPTANAARSAI